MGFIKKTFRREEPPAQVQTPPQPTVVTSVSSADTEADTASATKAKKKRQGFASTAVATSLDAASDDKKNTLG